jgi:uncharacterized protein YecE (DUF72 family)
VRPRPRIGCSGWNYKSWKGRFYPSELPSARWLDYYATTFDTVEVNNSFYRLPERSTFEAWRKQTPVGFLFAVKASRFLTHMKRLRDPDEPLARLFLRAAGLGTSETYELLDRYGCALCLHDKAGSAIEGPFVGPSAYVRFHGTSGRYHGSYSDAALRSWSRRLVNEWRSGRAVFAYFNNDPEAVATENARRLRSFVDGLANR